MKFKNIINSILETRQSRVDQGAAFENWFEETYDVNAAAEHLKKGNIEIRFSKIPDKFPAVGMYKDLTPESILIKSTDGSAFRLVKADFQNKPGKNEGLPNIYNKKTNKVINIKGEEKGNLFELKKSIPSFKKSIMFSEFKKIGTYDSFIRAFGTEEQRQEWKDLKTRQEKKEMWKRVLPEIKEQAAEQIKNHNELINYIRNTLNEVKNEVEGDIRKRIKNVLKGKGWFLVKGSHTKKACSFYKINVNKFVNNLTFQTTSWQGIQRIVTKINPIMTENTLANKINELSGEETSEMVELNFGKIEVELAGDIDVDKALKASEIFAASDAIQAEVIAASTKENNKRKINETKKNT